MESDDLYAVGGQPVKLEDAVNSIVKDKKNLNAIHSWHLIQIDDNDAEMWNLVRDISSMHMEVRENKVVFSPFMVMDGKRTFGSEDINDSILNQMEFIIDRGLPDLLLARFSDVLWSVGKRYKYADIANKAYSSLFLQHKHPEHWTTGVEYLRRVLMIAKQINKNDLINDAFRLGKDYLEEMDGRDPLFASIATIELFLDCNYPDVSYLLGVLEKLQKETVNNCHRMEEIHAQKLRCLSGVEKIEEKKRMALYYEEEAAHSLQEKNIRGIFLAKDCLEKAVNIWKSVGDPEERIRVHKKLVSVQEKIPGMMQPISFKMDVSYLHEYCSECLKGLSFQEAIIRFGEIVPFWDYEQERKELLTGGESIFEQLFPSAWLGTHGETKFKLPPLDKDSEQSINTHLHIRYKKSEENFAVIGKTFALTIKEKYCITLDDLDFLVMNNALIPEGRESVIRSAIYMFLKGYAYEAIHILAPQMEHVFRELARTSGGLTIKLGKDDISEEILLSSIFEMEELKDILDPNLLFLFKGLLNEKAGSNIRNEIAHGIMTSGTANSGACVYFCCAVIKLLSLTSGKCLEIITKNPTILKLPEAQENLIKIIH